MEMDAKLWSKLALDLLVFHILPHLPFFQCLALRSVCRHWKTLLVSKSYLEHCQTISPLNSSSVVIWSALTPQSSAAVKQSMHKIQVYDRFSDEWSPLKALPTQLTRTVDSSHFVPITSGQGLVCFQNMCYGSREMVGLSVWSPTLNQWMNLPPLISTEPIYNSSFESSYSIDSSFVSLVPKEGDSGFYFILVGLSKIWMFDSAMNSWKEVICADLFASKCLKVFCGVVVIEMVAYVYAYEFLMGNHDESSDSESESDSDRDDESIFLLKYDINQDCISRCMPMEDKRWSDVHLEMHPWLMEINGHVGIMEWHDDSELYLWMFHTSAMEWSFLKSITLPSRNYLIDFTGCYNVIKDHNLIYFLSYSMEYHEAFDLERNEWKRLADSASPLDSFDNEIVIFSFKYCSHSLF